MDKVSKVVLSFDDGRRDNVTLIRDILVSNGLPVTLNLSTGYIDGTARKERYPGPNPAMTLEEAKELASLPGVEIAGHGWEHLNTLEDLKKGVDTLRTWFPNQEICGIASPNSILHEDEILAHQAEYEAMGVRYVRIGAGATYSGARRVMGKLSRSIHNDWLFVTSNQGAVEHTFDRFVLTAVPVMRQQTKQQVEALVDYCWKNGKDLILMFHSVVHKKDPFHDDTWSWDYEDFVSLAYDLKELDKAGKIQLTTTADAVAK